MAKVSSSLERDEAVNSELAVESYKFWLSYYRGINKVGLENQLVAQELEIHVANVKRAALLRLLAEDKAGK